MEKIFLFFIELFILFLLSKSLTQLVFTFLYQTTRNKKVSIYFMSILFLPGTIMHELSHAVMALLLRVGVGNMEFMPKLINENLKLGSVQVAKSDPIRRFLIGAAPFLCGISTLLGIFFYGAKANIFDNNLTIVVTTYLVFEIGNTMFSSKKDMEGSIELLIALIFIALISYFVGLKVPAFNPDLLFSNPLIQETFQKADLYLLLPVIIDLVLILIIKLLKR